MSLRLGHIWTELLPPKGVCMFVVFLYVSGFVYRGLQCLYVHMGVCILAVEEAKCT